MLKKNIILKSVICAFLILISGIAVSAQGGGALGAGCRDDVWSAEITLNPSTIQAGQQGTATVTITGASPGGFAINLQGAATGSSGTVVWCTIPVPGGNPCPGGNICQSRYTIPFTAVSSGNVEVYIPHRGQVIGSAPLIVTGSATTTSTTSGTGSSSTSAATTTSSGSTSSTTPQIYVRRVDGVSGDGPQGTVSCEVGDLRIGDCQDIGYRFNHGCDATSERTCRAWERVGNLGAAGCLIICQRGGGTIAGTTTGGTGSATTGGTTGSTGGTSTATTTASCPAGYSASVSFPPVSAGQTGNAQVTLIGVRPPGNFIIYLRGAANNGDVPPTIFIDNWESRFVDNNPCVTRHTVPFTAGSSSGQVQAHLNFFGGFGTNIAPASTQLTLGQASGTPAGTVITPQPPPVVTGTTVSSPIVGSSVPFDIRGSNFGTNRGRIEFLDASNNPSGTFIESNVANRWNLEWRSDSQIVVTMLQGQTQSWTPNVQGTIRFRVINANGVPSGPSQVTFTPLP
ncbi:hypothetical protein HYY71_01000, partial [Candidatus Woesearchaeota archaeon]|nr:hypothetical protein [Candidatus Woesearchaeota archaeon]